MPHSDESPQSPRLCGEPAGTSMRNALILRAVDNVPDADQMSVLRSLRHIEFGPLGIEQTLPLNDDAPNDGAESPRAASPRAPCQPSQPPQTLSRTTTATAADLLECLEAIDCDTGRDECNECNDGEGGDGAQPKEVQPGTPTEEGAHIRWEKRYVEVSLGIFPQTSRIRRACVRLVEWSYFETLVVTVIFANCVLLAAYDPTKPVDAPGRNAVINKSEIPFMSFFLLEMVVKVVAMGFVGDPRCYLRDPWNVMDFLVVVGCVVSLLPSLGGNVSSVRTIRMLRPLRTINMLPGMRVLVGTILRSLPMLGNVMLLTVSLFLLFGISGVQLFGGVLRNRCFIARASPGSLSRMLLRYHAQINVGGSGQGIGADSVLWHGSAKYPGYAMAGDRVCTNRTLPWPGNVCDKERGAVCFDVENPDFGMTGFDDFIMASLTIFQLISMEGWTDIMYNTMDGSTGWAFLYFLTLLFLGSFFLLNLVLAVVTEVYSETAKVVRVYDIMQKKKATRRRYGPMDLVRFLKLDVAGRAFLSAGCALLPRCRPLAATLRFAHRSIWDAPPCWQRHRSASRPQPRRFRHVVRKVLVHEREQRRSLGSGFSGSDSEKNLGGPDKERRASLHSGSECDNNDPDNDTNKESQRDSDITHRNVRKGLHSGSESDKDPSRRPLHSSFKPDEDDNSGRSIIADKPPTPDGRSIIADKPPMPDLSDTAGGGEDVKKGNGERKLERASVSPAPGAHGARRVAFGWTSGSESDNDTRDSSHGGSRPSPGESGRMGDPGGPGHSYGGWGHDGSGNGARFGAGKVRRLSAGSPMGPIKEKERRLSVDSGVHRVGGPVGQGPRRGSVSGSYSGSGSMSRSRSFSRSGSGRVAGGGHFYGGGAGGGGGGGRGVSRLEMFARLLGSTGQEGSKWEEGSDVLLAGDPSVHSMGSLVKHTSSLARMASGKEGSNKEGRRDREGSNGEGSGKEGRKEASKEGSTKLGTGHTEGRGNKEAGVRFAATASWRKLKRSLSHTLRRGPAPASPWHLLRDNLGDDGPFLGKGVAGGRNGSQQHKRRGGLSCCLRPSASGAKGGSATGVGGAGIGGWFRRSHGPRCISGQVISHKLFTYVVLAAILINTVVLSMEYYDMPAKFLNVLEQIGVGLTALFITEAVLKVAGMGVHEYVNDPYNVLDVAVVVTSVMELFSTGTRSLSAMRALRVLRVMKLIRTWRSLQRFLLSICRTLSQLGNFVLIVALVVFIYALLGMQLFGGKLGNFPEGLPRHHFDTLLWACITVFQVLTGEGWNEVMYDAVRGTSRWAQLYFISLMIVGNYLVINLFLAILLSYLKEEQRDDPRRAPSIQRRRRRGARPPMRKPLIRQAVEMYRDAKAASRDVRARWAAARGAAKSKARDGQGSDIAAAKGGNDAEKGGSYDGGVIERDTGQGLVCEGDYNVASDDAMALEMAPRSGPLGLPWWRAANGTMPGHGEGALDGAEGGFGGADIELRPTDKGTRVGGTVALGVVSPTYRLGACKGKDGFTVSLEGCERAGGVPCLEPSGTPSFSSPPRGCGSASLPGNEYSARSMNAYSNRAMNGHSNFTQGATSPSSHETENGGLSHHRQGPQSTSPYSHTRDLPWDASLRPLGQDHLVGPPRNPFSPMDPPGGPLDPQFDPLDAERATAKLHPLLSFQSDYCGSRIWNRGRNDSTQSSVFGDIPYEDEGVGEGGNDKEGRVQSDHRGLHIWNRGRNDSTQSSVFCDIPYKEEEGEGEGGNDKRQGPGANEMGRSSGTSEMGGGPGHRAAGSVDFGRNGNNTGMALGVMGGGEDEGTPRLGRPCGVCVSTGGAHEGGQRVVGDSIGESGALFDVGDRDSWHGEQEGDDQKDSNFSGWEKRARFWLSGRSRTAELMPLASGLTRSITTSLGGRYDSVRGEDDDEGGRGRGDGGGYSDGAGHGEDQQGKSSGRRLTKCMSAFGFPRFAVDGSGGPFLNGSVSNNPLFSGSPLDSSLANTPLANAPLASAPLANAPLANGPLSNGPLANGLGSSERLTLDGAGVARPTFGPCRSFGAGYLRRDQDGLAGSELRRCISNGGDAGGYNQGSARGKDDYYTSVGRGLRGNVDDGAAGGLGSSLGHWGRLLERVGGEAAERDVFQQKHNGMNRDGDGVDGKWYRCSGIHVMGGLMMSGGGGGGGGEIRRVESLPDGGGDVLAGDCDASELGRTSSSATSSWNSTTFLPGEEETCQMVAGRTWETRFMPEDGAAGDREDNDVPVRQWRGASPLLYEEYTGRSLFIFPVDSRIRRWCFRLVDSFPFEVLVMAVILASSFILAYESPGVRENEARAERLERADMALTALFAAELVLKFIAWGGFLTPGSYLRSGWNVMDLVIVVAAIVPMLLSSRNVRWVCAMRTLRVLRPLRLLTRVPELQVVTNALIRSLSSLWNVVIVAVLFWLIFGLLGMQLFAGRFYYCSDDSLAGSPREACVGFDGRDGSPREWRNKDCNFDNILNAMLCLFEMATTEGWTEVMYSGVDAVGVNVAPIRDHHEAYTAFFVIFMILGAFFIFNVFIGNIVDNFSRQREEQRVDYLFLTLKQRKWVETTRKAMHQCVVPRPVPLPAAASLRKWLSRAVDHPNFDFVMMAVIAANILILALQHYNQGPVYGRIQEISSIVFTAIYIAEAAAKILVFGPVRYFVSWWNRFDFFLVVLSIIGLATSTTFLASLFRIFRIARLFRMVRYLSGLRMLLTTLIISAPTLANTLGLLAVLFFVFAVLGMQLFGRVKPGETLDEHSNFKNFGYSILTLLRMVTGENWNGIMYDCMVQPPDCDNSPEVDNCGLRWAWLYFVSFVLMGSFVMFNLFIAVVLENFSASKLDNDNQVTVKHLHEFRRIWVKHFDPHRCNFISPERFEDLLRKVPPPLGVCGKVMSRNEMALFQNGLFIPVTGNFLFYQDVLNALTQRAMGLSIDDLPPEVRDTLKRKAQARREQAHLRLLRKHLGVSAAANGMGAASGGMPANVTGDASNSTHSTATSSQVLYLPCIDEGVAPAPAPAAGPPA
eukprot:jgi/Mesvir1/15823/Mv03377-RA.1